MTEEAGEEAGERAWERAWERMALGWRGESTGSERRRWWRWRDWWVEQEWLLVGRLNVLHGCHGWQGDERLPVICRRHMAHDGQWRLNILCVPVCRVVANQCVHKGIPIALLH